MRYFVIRLFGLLIIVNSICLCYLRYHADWQTQRVNGLIRCVYGDREDTMNYTRLEGRCIKDFDEYDHLVLQADSFWFCGSGNEILIKTTSLTVRDVQHEQLFGRRLQVSGFLYGNILHATEIIEF